MRLRLQELQSKNKQAQKFRVEQLVKDQQDIKGVLYYQGFLYVPEIIWTKLISKHHNNPLIGYFDIKKIQELVAQKYPQPIICHNVDNYIMGYNIFLALKIVRHKPYNNLQSLPIPIYCQKDLLIDFVTDLPILTNWKRDSYNSILVIIDRLTKLIHYKLVKIIINALGLAEIIINVVVRYHGLSDSIVTDWGLFFTSKFWLSLYYSLGIKQKLSTAFYSQTDGQTQRQNNTIEAYL